MTAYSGIITKVKQHKPLIRFFIVLLLCVEIGWMVSALYKENIVNDIHSGNLFTAYERMRGTTLEEYCRAIGATPIFYIISLTFTALFFLLFLKVLTYVLREARAEHPVRVNESDRRRRHDLLTAFLLYTLCTLIFFSPCLQYFSNALIGPPSDNFTYYWNMWWADKAFSEKDLTLTFSNKIFYPEGSSLYYQAYNFYCLFLSLILRKLLSPALSYNLLMLHSFVLSGVGAFLLIHYITRHRFASFVGGFIFAFNPSHFAHSLYHMGIASIQFIPFFVLYFIKALRGNSKRDLFLAGIFFLLTSACSWYYMIFALYFMFFCYLFLVYKRKRCILPDVIRKAAFIVSGTVIIFSPWLVHMVLLGIRHPAVAGRGHNKYVADILAFFVPHYYHGLRKLNVIALLNMSFTGNFWEKTAYLGLVNIAVIAYAFRKIVRLSARYFCAFFAFLLLAMGEFVHVAGVTTPIMLPYRLIKFAPFLQNARVPSRIIVYCYLFLAIIVAVALKHLFATAAFKKRVYLAPALAALIFIDYSSLCTTMSNVYEPRCYRVIERMEPARADTFGILDIPFCNSRSKARYMMYQTQHEFPIVQGYLSRLPGKPLLRYVEKKNLKKQKRQLAAHKVKYIVIHKRLLSPEVMRHCPVDVQGYKSVYSLLHEDKEYITLQVYQ